MSIYIQTTNIQHTYKEVCGEDTCMEGRRRIKERMLFAIDDSYNLFFLSNL